MSRPKRLSHKYALRKIRKAMTPQMTLRYCDSEVQVIMPGWSVRVCGPDSIYWTKERLDEIIGHIREMPKKADGRWKDWAEIWLGDGM